MRRNLLTLMLVAVAAGINAEEVTDSMNLQDVVVTGTRNATDVRYLPMTVSVIGRQTLTEQYQTSVLPTAMQQVPDSSSPAVPCWAMGSPVVPQGASTCGASLAAVVS